MNQYDEMASRESMRPMNKGYTLRIHGGESIQSNNDSQQKVRQNRDRRQQRKQRGK